MSSEFRILIVDDEKMVREGIVCTLPWEELHIRVVGTASNGRDALDLVRKLKPHIVLTDVRMPFLDGLELIEAIRDEAPHIKTIILSAYDEFEYARKAIQLGAIDYILKPIQADELTALLRRVAQMFQEDVEREILLNGIRKRVRESLPSYLHALQKGDLIESIRFIKDLFPASKPAMWKYGRDILTIVIQELHLDGNLPFFMEEILSEIRTSSDLIHSATDLDLFLQVICGILQDRVIKNQKPTLPSVIQTVLEFVHTHYAEVITVQGVAHWIGLNPDYFSHVFKKYMGVNFIGYVNRYRIDQAETLLKQESLKIYEIAERVGFQDYKYFSKLFHQWKGYRPTDVRGKRSL